MVRSASSRVSNHEATVKAATIQAKPEIGPEDDDFGQNVSPFEQKPLSPAPDSLSSSLIDMKFTFVVCLHIC
jgi:hypothetical protein